MANVLLHTLLFPPDGNSNAYIFADIALELQKYGHKVTVITTTPHYSVLAENFLDQPLSAVEKTWYKTSDFHGIKCFHIVVPSEKGSIKQRLLTFLKFHFYSIRLANRKDINADVVITQSPPLSIGIVNGRIARIKKAKAVYVVQDLFPDGPIDQGKIRSKFLIRLLRAMEQNVYRHNDAIIAISRGIKLHLEKRVPADKLLKIIPNFVNTQIYHPLPPNNPLAVRYNVQGKFVVSYVGNIGNAHDLTPLLFSAKRLKDLNINFIIAGNGIRRAYYENMAKVENLENVHFIGYQKREDTPFINAFSDVCLVMLAPHVKDYSFPSKIYTLMSMAKPIIVISSPASDAAKFVEETKSGWFIQTGQNDEFTQLLRDLYFDRSQLNIFGKNALAAVQDYTIETIGKQYDQLIGDLLSC